MATPRALSIGEDQGNAIIVVGSVFAGLATVAVVGRFCARRLKRLHYGPDDWMTLVALVCNSVKAVDKGADWSVLGLELGFFRNHGPR